MDFGIMVGGLDSNNGLGLGITAGSTAGSNDDVSSSVAAGGGGFGSLSGSAASSSDPETKQRVYGSGLLLPKQEERSAAGSSSGLDEYCYYYWPRSSKVAKTDHDLASSPGSKGMLLQQRNAALLRSSCGSNFFLDNGNHQHQMLSFTSPKSEALMVEKTNATPILTNYFPNSLSAAYSTRNTGFNNGSLNGTSMHGAITGGRGVFTPSQRMELEHQALIYKYITANVPIPTNLLIPIRKAFDSTGFSSFPPGLLSGPNALGWGGSFHLGFSNNADPEPGRCRRTDGKKWRCSRDAVADQKYCERHMNRGRHRSRKPVEGQTGHAVAAAAAAKLTPMSSSSSSAAVPGAGGAANCLAINANRQMQSLESAASNSSAAAHINRMFVKDNAGERMQQNSPGLSLLSRENSFSTRPKQQIPYDMSSREFGLVTSDSLLNPSQKVTSSVMSSRNFGTSRDLTDGEANQSTQHSSSSLRQFMDDWPKAQSNHRGPALSWPDIDIQSDRTQLSISIPNMTPNDEQTSLSPLRLSRELDRDPMGLGLGDRILSGNRQANWVPIAWDQNSLGGPLGEVLHQTNNNNNNNNNSSKGSLQSGKNSSLSSSSVLNLMTEGWDSSPPMGSSPTGVLQKTAFGSLSNSSAGSSPRAENNNRPHEIGAILCNDLLGGSASAALIT